MELKTVSETAVRRRQGLDGYKFDHDGTASSIYDNMISCTFSYGDDTCTDFDVAVVNGGIVELDGERPLASFEEDEREFILEKALAAYAVTHGV